MTIGDCRAISIDSIGPGVCEKLACPSRVPEEIKAGTEYSLGLLADNREHLLAGIDWIHGHHRWVCGSYANIHPRMDPPATYRKSPSSVEE